MRASDTVTGLVLIALAGVMVYLTLSFPAFPGQKFGPSLFPRVLASGLALCGLLLIWRGIGSGGAAVTIAPWMREPKRLGSFLLLPAIVIAYIFLSEPIGFIPVAFAMLLLLFAWFGVRPLTAVVVAVLATISIHWFFATMLRVPLPRGLLTHVL